MLTRVTSNQWPFLFGSPEVPPKPTHSKENWHICLFYLFLAHLHIRKTNLMAPFHGWGSTASRLEPLRGGSFMFLSFPFKNQLLYLFTFHVHF